MKRPQICGCGVLVLVLAGCARTIAFPATPAGRFLREAYASRGDARTKVFENYAQLKDEERRAVAAAAARIVENHADAQLWGLAYIAMQDGIDKAAMPRLSPKWLPIVIQALDNPNVEESIYAEKMPAMVAAMMLWCFTPDQIRPYLPAIERRYSAPFLGHSIGENPECMTYYFLGGVLAAMSADGVPGLLRGLDHKQSFIRDESMNRLNDTLSIPVGKTFAGSGGVKVPLLQPRTEKQQAQIRALLHRHLPRFIAALGQSEGGYGNDHLTDTTAEIIVSLARPDEVTPHLVNMFEALRQRRQYGADHFVKALQALRPKMQSANLLPEKLLEAAYTASGEKRHELLHELTMVEGPAPQKLLPRMLEIVRTDRSARMLPIAYIANLWSPGSLQKDAALVAAMPELVKALRTPSPDEALCLEPLPSFAALALIETAGPEAAQPYIKELGEALNAQPMPLSNQERRTRRQLADMMLAFGREGLPALAKAWAHPDPDVRDGAIIAFARLLDMAGLHQFEPPRWFIKSRLVTREEARAFAAQNAHALATVIHDEHPGDKIIEAVTILGDVCYREDLPESDLKRLEEIGQSDSPNAVYVSESAKAYDTITSRTRKK